jgi:hypothetical protein
MVALALTTTTKKEKDMVAAYQCYPDVKAEARAREEAESQAAKAAVQHEKRRRPFYAHWTPVQF